MSASKTSSILVSEYKFDYITLIGVLEYANLYTYTENPYIDFLNSIKKFLKKDGKLLIAIENKLGMKLQWKKNSQKYQIHHFLSFADKLF